MSICIKMPVSTLPVRCLEPRANVPVTLEDVPSLGQRLPCPKPRLLLPR
jgi:hypothetical protein